MTTTAFENGVKDGVEAVVDAGEVTAEEVESWFAAGKLDPDEGLINACTSEQLADTLGLTEAQVEERGDEWSAALAEYNRGYRTGARREVASE